MKISRMNMNSLFYILVSMLVFIMIFCPTHASGDGQLKYSNETNRAYNAQQDVQWKIVKESPGGSKYVHNETDLKTNIDSNAGFTFFDNRSGVMSFDLTSFLNDRYLSCKGNFKCTANFTTGWKDDTSFQVSTRNNTNNTWSFIRGDEINVEPRTVYHLVSHMKVDRWAIASHIVLQGFNETSQRWYQIIQCPAGINGPREWKEFSCVTQIPEKTSKIRPVLNAGWSSDPKKEATTWFDSPDMVELIQPFIFDPNLKAEIVYQGLEKPSSMAFLGPNDILVLEDNLKDKEGTVQRIVNGIKLGKPLLDLNITFPEGLLGIAVEKNVNMNRIGTNKELTYVFIYVAGAKKVSDDLIKENGSVGNRLYRYEFINNTLANPKLLLDLPPGSEHDGGPIVIGPDKHLYLAVGESKNKTTLSHEKNRALNYEGKEAYDPDGRGGILRVDQNGKVSNTHDILSDKEPLNKYYAYGIRNSFGMDFDPLTGKLWDTENGPGFGDEINLVEPGFNSGWRKVQGIWTVLRGEREGEEKKGNLASEKPDNLVDFGGKGKYSPPEFTWNNTVGPTAIKFLSTDKLGKQYENDILVADTNGPRIYHFELDQNRTALHLQGPLIDKVAQSNDELANVVFAKDFGSRITDLEIGPDGYLYVVLFDAGKIYRIVPNYLNNNTDHSK
jgi:aldose sugar dehydrogenase